MNTTAAPDAIPKADHPEHWSLPPAKFKLYGLYKGQVVQRTDPARLGRLRVRVVGVHDSSIAVPDLPWASPRQPAWNKGGRSWTPPLFDYVWVQFEEGSVEYPVWDGGWYSSSGQSSIQTPDGAGDSANVLFPTTKFGGARRNTGLLAMESFSGVDPANQPNNYVDRTPLGKHQELDDRLGFEKLKLSDQLDNYLWTSTEWGVTTLEASRGLNPAFTPQPFWSQAGRCRGLTLNSPDQVVQLYSFQNWFITIDDANKFVELSAPSGSRVRISDQDQTCEMWTRDGQMFRMDDAARRVTCRTVQGRQLVLDDAAQLMQLGDGTSVIEFKQGNCCIRVPGTFGVQAGGDIGHSAGGMIVDQGSQIHHNSFSPTIPASTPVNPPARPATVELCVRAPYATDTYPRT
jgi:hypothetical protein